MSLECVRNDLCFSIWPETLAALILRMNQIHKLGLKATFEINSAPLSSIYLHILPIILTGTPNKTTTLGVSARDYNLNT